MHSSTCDVSQDPLVNPLSRGTMGRYFAPDPNFPAPPNLVFKEPIGNFGPGADKFRNPVCLGKWEQWFTAIVAFAIANAFVQVGLLSKPGATVGPGPSRGEVNFYIENGSGGTTTLRVFVIEGKSVLAKASKYLSRGNGVLNADLKALPSGTYEVQLRQGNRQTSGKLALMK